MYKAGEMQKTHDLMRCGESHSCEASTLILPHVGNVALRWVIHNLFRVLRPQNGLA